jgi:succinate dehydrogenase flavin-adding protein (antitoxin of CptAB toxin-antitoxin module)
MITYDDLHTQNHKITELTNVLTALMSERTLLDTDITCELFFRYVDEVKDHLDVTDRSLYTQLLSSKDKDVNKIGNQFMSGSQEIKRVFDQYLKKWCKLNNRNLVVKNYDQFINETDGMFMMVLNRIQDETEKLYPVARRISGDEIKAA